MIYNVVLNSNNNAGGTNTSNFQYNFDWSNFEEGAYELTFLFNAVGSTVDKLIVVSCPDLGVASNVFTTKGTATAQSFNNVLGVVYPTTSLDYIVSAQHNPPIYLQTRPYSNHITIYLYDTAGALVNIGIDYVLILSLKKI
jgi:hypothetical protein